MTEAYWERLIQGHLDGVLSEAEEAELAALLGESEAARRYFWELAEVHGLARDAARIAWPEDDAAPVRLPPASSSPERSAGFWSARFRSAGFRSAGLVAAGLALGVVMTGLAWAIARPTWGTTRVLLDEGFESGVAANVIGVPIAGGVPTEVDRWSGDVAEVVEAQSGVRPAGDRRMLRFLRSDFTGKPNPGGYIGDVYRLIDVRDSRGDLAGDEALVQVSARFNAAEFGEDERYHCSMAVYALDRATATDGSTRQASTIVDRALAVTRRSNERLDRDPATWQKISTELRLPAGTDYLLLRISVAHGPPTNKTESRTTFPAHFADDVRVILARRPLLP